MTGRSLLPAITFSFRGARFAMLMALTTILLGIGASALAENRNPGVFPPNSHPYGMTYGEWSAAWWQWALAIPADENPILDTTGENAGINQRDDVFFLAGTFGTAEQRSVTVSAGQSILFPILNAVCWAPEDGDTVEELAACAGSFFSGNVELEATVDGTPLEDLFTYRAVSPGFAFEGGEIFGLEPGRDLNVSDGFWVMLNPLPPGQHEIDFRGALLDFGFETSVEYDITVVGRALHAVAVPEPSAALLLGLGLTGLLGCFARTRVTA